MSRHAHLVADPEPLADGRLLRLRSIVVTLAVAMALVLVAGILVEEVRVRGVQDAPGVVQVAVWQGARLLYADAEANAWAWLSTIGLALLAAVFAASAAARRGASLPWRATAFLSGVALLLSADEGAMLHETLNEIGIRLTDSLGQFNAWLIPGVVVVLVAGVVLLRVARSLDRRLRWRLVVAGAIFLLGAIGMEAAGAAYTLSHPGPNNPWETPVYHLMVAAEEGLEAVGILVALAAAMATVEVRLGGGGLVVTPGGDVGRARP